MEIMLVIIVFCVIMSAYFSATETAFSTFNRIRMKNMAEKGKKRAELVLKLSERYDTLISTILIGNNIVNILASSLATVVFALWITDAGTSTTVSTVVMTLLVLIFGEIVPKTLAKQFIVRTSHYQLTLCDLTSIISICLRLYKLCIFINAEKFF